VLASRSSARVPQSPDKTITRTSVFWGAGTSITTDEKGCRSVHVLPFGVLLDHTTDPGESSLHILGTGISRQKATEHSGSTARFRLLGIPIWTTHGAPPKRG
jgi:hypothetical protein